jgi:hypothetical protein
VIGVDERRERALVTSAQQFDHARLILGRRHAGERAGG